MLEKDVKSIVSSLEGAIERNVALLVGEIDTRWNSVRREIKKGS
jgi:hypothetical protein